MFQTAYLSVKRMQETPACGTHNIQFKDATGKKQKAELSVKFTSMTVLPPIGKQKRYKHQKFQIIHAEEQNPPEGREPIFWKLITNLDVFSHEEAVKKLNWYARRWSIETYFKTLKSGCKIEEVRLTTATRLTNFIALCCIVAWRVHWMVMLRRENPEALPSTVFTDPEIEFLNQSVSISELKKPQTLDFYMIKVARLGGYLARKNDPPPGATVMWRGMARLADLLEGFSMGQQGK